MLLSQHRVREDVVVRVVACQPSQSNEVALRECAVDVYCVKDNCDATLERLGSLHPCTRQFLTVPCRFVSGSKGCLYPCFIHSLLTE
jgi:hypothetical protein